MDARPVTIRSRIGRVRVRQARDDDPLRLKLAVERSLAGTELEPSAFPRGALLLLRELRVRVSVSFPSRPEILASSVRDQAAVLARRAVRPERGRLPAGAAGVLFVDLAQALEVFALSVSEGRAAGEWWWQRLWPRLERWNFVSLFLEHGEEVPQALAHLTADGALGVVARGVSNAAAEALFRAVAARFGLYRFAASVDRLRAESGDGAENVAKEPADESTTVGARERELYVQRELARIAPIATDPGLQPNVRLWLAACAGVIHAPALVRNTEFVAPTARALLQLTRATQTRPDGGGARRSPGAAEPWERGSPLEAGPGAARIALCSEPEPRREVYADVQPGDGDGAACVLTVVDAGTASGATAAAAPDVPPQPLVLEPSDDAELGWRAERLRTDFAGVFYLANVALALELYGDFTEPARPELPCLFWDFLALAAEWLLPAAARADLRADPLWSWLAARSGRAPEEVPAGADWVATLMPRIEQRLERALGAEPARILRQVGTIVRRGSRVDVHCSLTLHPFDVRLAGLDRDLGWIPAAGADLRFVYA
jgi:hypothetical protein